MYNIYIPNIPNIPNIITFVVADRTIYIPLPYNIVDFIIVINFFSSVERRSLVRSHTDTHIHTHTHTHYTYRTYRRIHTTTLRVSTAALFFTECDIDLPADPSPLGGIRRTQLQSTE